jgi:uncharacterized protein
MTAQRPEYSVKFTGLTAGTHTFRFDIGQDLFRDRTESIIMNADIQAIVDLVKGGTMQLDLKLSGWVEVECARCLEPVRIPVDVQKSLLVRQVENPRPEDDDDDAIHIANHAHAIDLESVLYDYLTLQVPYRTVHPDKENGEPGCNPEILKFLRSEGAEEEKSEEKGNDTWDALRNIRLN